MSLRLRTSSLKNTRLQQQIHLHCEWPQIKTNLITNYYLGDFNLLLFNNQSINLSNTIMYCPTSPFYVVIDIQNNENLQVSFLLWVFQPSGLGIRDPHLSSVPACGFAHKSQSAFLVGYLHHHPHLQNPRVFIIRLFCFIAVTTLSADISHDVLGLPLPSSRSYITHYWSTDFCPNACYAHTRHWWKVHHYVFFFFSFCFKTLF